MSSTRQNDDFPTIRLDEEDRRDYQQKKQTTPVSNTTPKAPNSSNPSTQGGSKVLAICSLLVALAASGASYYLYDVTQKQAAAAQDAEARIFELERKLSATDEEMGESTIALQVKVTELAEKTTELWDQMDKLWASAWRRNQKEIADLAARVTSTKNGLQESIDQVSRVSSSQKTQIAAVKSQIETQLATLADELLAVNVQIDQMSSDKNNALQTNKNLQEQLAVIEQRNSALSGRITQLENEIKSMATKVLSQSSTLGAGTP